MWPGTFQTQSNFSTLWSERFGHFSGTTLQNTRGEWGRVGAKVRSSTGIKPMTGERVVGEGGSQSNIAHMLHISGLILKSIECLTRDT